MLPDPRWIAFADEDLEVAGLVHRERYWGKACFLSQQAAEKYLKSTLSPEDRPRTHRIQDLVHRVGWVEDEGLRAALRRLDRFYLPSRYPDALPGGLETGLPLEADASEALATARALRQRLWECFRPGA
jgi:HEPN domain-containing protein